MTDFLLFRVRGQQYATPMSDVVEIFQPGKISHLPAYPKHMDGVTLRHGSMLQLIDLPKLLGHGDGGDANLVLSIRLSTGEQAGLLVDEVCDTISAELADSFRDNGIIVSEGKPITIITGQWAVALGLSAKEKSVSRRPSSV